MTCKSPLTLFSLSRLVPFSSGVIARSRSLDAHHTISQRWKSSQTDRDSALHAAFGVPSLWSSAIKSALDLPVDVEESAEQGTLIPRLHARHVGTASLLGRREDNEDRLLVSQLAPNLLLVGIFDGHGGAAAADLARALMPECVRYRLAELREKLRHSGQSLSRISNSQLEATLYACFLQVNNLMARHFLYYGTARERQWSGTTATVALLRHSHQLVIAHVGDSRAVICRSGHIEPLTVDHDPSSLVLIKQHSDEPKGLTEADRIAKCGGKVITNSLGVPVVNGRLGMTRSLGDAELKAFGVTAQAHTTSLQVRHSRASFLALVSDGVSHVMSDSDVLGAVICGRTTAEAAQQIVETALLYGSEDNASAIVVPFGSWGKTFQPISGPSRLCSF